MAKYLDPKADLTFKKVFGEHKELFSKLSEDYGCPQWMLSDDDVVKFIDKYADTLSIESIYYSIDKYWDQISRERTIENAAERKGEAKGRAEGRAEEKKQNALKMKQKGYPIEDIAEITGLPIGEIEIL